MKRVEARKRLIETYKKTNSIRKTAKFWKASYNLVRKWVKRYKQGGGGLRDLSRRPKRSPLRPLIK